MTSNHLPISLSTPDSHLVRWEKLEAEFARIYARTIMDVIGSQTRAQVRYCGIPYIISPHQDGFRVLGPVAVNQFPSQLFVI